MITAKQLAENYVSLNPSEFPDGVKDFADLEATFTNWLNKPRLALSNWCGKVTKAFFVAHNVTPPKRMSEVESQFAALYRSPVTPPSEKATAHTPTPWVIDDRHIHPAKGMTYGQLEPETDIIVEVNTDCHERGLLNDIDRANMELIVKAVNSHAALVAALETIAQRAIDYPKNEMAHLNAETANAALRASQEVA